MGIKLSCLRADDDHPISSKRSCENNEGKESLTEHSRWLCGKSTMKAKKKKEQSRVHQHEKHDEDVEFHKSKNKRVQTLEDWILSSPSWNNEVGVGKASSRKKVHPSFDAKTEGFPVKVEEVETGTSSSVKKLKKKVSFRSPEVADIFVLNVSPDQAHIHDQNRPQ